MFLILCGKLDIEYRKILMEPEFSKKVPNFFLGQKRAKIWSKRVKKRKIRKKITNNLKISHKITKNTKKIKKIFLGPKNIFWAFFGPKSGQNRSKKGKILKRVVEMGK